MPHLRTVSPVSRCSLVRMILAQALGEYGLASALQEGILQAVVQVEDTLRHPQPIHYGMAGLVVALLWLFMRRRS